MKLQPFLSQGKILVTTGWPLEIGFHTEIIDVSNTENSCNVTFENYPIQVNLAFGGLLKNEFPLICGGWYGNHSAKNCYVIGKEDEIATELLIPRNGGSSVVLFNEVLWVRTIFYPFTSYFDFTEILIR